MSVGETNKNLNASWADQAEKLEEAARLPRRRNSRSAYTLVPLEEAAEKYFKKQKFRTRENTDKDFYDKVTASIIRGDFEGCGRRLVVVANVRVLQSKLTKGNFPPYDHVLSVQTGYLAKSWTTVRAAKEWCKANDFPVPSRWKAILAKSAERTWAKPLAEPKTPTILQARTLHSEMGCEQQWHVKTVSKFVEAPVTKIEAPAKPDRQLSTKRAPTSIAEVRKVFVERVKNWPADLPHPSEKTDQDFLAEHFGGGVPRRLFRPIRQEIAPNWLQRGRPTKPKPAV